jgi:hypothetical protein
LEGLRVKVATVCAPAGKIVVTVSAVALSAVITTAVQALRQSAEIFFSVESLNDFLRKCVWRSPAGVKTETLANTTTLSSLPGAALD